MLGLAILAAAEPASAGLPQFDASQWPGQVFWMLVSFGLLLALFFWVFTPRVGGTIAMREDRISGDIGQARRLRDEAEAQSQAARQDLTEARARAHRMAAEAKSAAGTEAARRQSEEEARLHRQFAEAEARIAAARGEAMGHVRAIAAGAAEAILERLTGEPGRPGEVEQALERAQG